MRMLILANPRFKDGFISLRGRARRGFIGDCTGGEKCCIADAKENHDIKIWKGDRLG
jgi:hypothetical protein